MSQTEVFPAYDTLQRAAVLKLFKGKSNSLFVPPFAEFTNL